MPPVIAMRDLRSLSFPAQVVHFIPMQATPRPAMDTMMPTIINARVAWREPGDRQVNAKVIYLIKKHHLYTLHVKFTTLTETILCKFWKQVIWMRQWLIKEATSGCELSWRWHAPGYLNWVTHKQWMMWKTDNSMSFMLSRFNCRFQRGGATLWETTVSILICHFTRLDIP